VVATNPASVPIGARIELSRARLSAVSGRPALDCQEELRAHQRKNPVPFVTPGLKIPQILAECHKRKQRTGSVFAGPPAKHASMRCSDLRLDHKNIIVPVPSVLRPSWGRVICVKLLSEG